MRAETVIKVLLGENDAEEFMSALPKHVMATFHVIKDGTNNVHIRNTRYPGHYLVYKNEENGTRDFAGLVNEVPDGWIVTAVAMKHSLRRVSTGEHYKTQDDAARELYRIYLEKQREAVDAVADRYRLGRP